MTYTGQEMFGCQAPYPGLLFYNSNFTCVKLSLMYCNDGYFM